MSEYEIRKYREQFNVKRFAGFSVIFRESDLWIGVDRESLLNFIIDEMKELTLQKIKELRKNLDDYISEEPQFAKSLDPFIPGKFAPSEAVEMAEAAAKAGIGPMSAVAGLFAREAGLEILQNFSPLELVIENGGDIFAVVKDELVLSVFAGKSPLSGKTGLIIPPGTGRIGVCTSAGTVGPSLSFGKADAVVVACKDILLADAFATALGNLVKNPDDIERVLDISRRYPEIISVLIICGDKMGVRGDYEVKIIK